MSQKLAGLLLGFWILGIPAMSIDLDGDGMSDIWEREYGAESLQPALDQDSDGFTNLEEAQIGSDPFDPTDQYAIKGGVTRFGHGAIVWTPRPGKVYTPRLKGSVPAAWTGVSFLSGGGPTEMKLALCQGEITGVEGAVMREIWTPLSGNDVGSIDESQAANITVFQSTIDLPPGAGEFYGARTSGFITPPASGSWRFWIASRNDSEFRFGPGPDQASTVIAHVTGVDVPPGDYDVDASQQSSAMFLTAGVEHRFEILHKATFGEDHLSVVWQGPGMASPEPIPYAALSARLPSPIPVIGGRPDTFFAQLGVHDTDTDGDRVDDWEEYIAGTSPFDPESGSRDQSLPVSDYITVGHQYDLFDVVTATFRLGGVAISSVAEGTTGVLLSMTRDYVSNVPTVIPFNNIGSATPGADYSTTGSQIVIPAGQLTATLPFTIIDDNVTEGSEQIQLLIQTGYAYDTLTLTITD